jgi:hypothetical protein
VIVNTPAVNEVTVPTVSPVLGVPAGDVEEPEGAVLVPEPELVETPLAVKLRTRARAAWRACLLE